MCWNNVSVKKRRGRSFDVTTLHGNSPTEKGNQSRFSRLLAQSRCHSLYSLFQTLPGHQFSIRLLYRVSEFGVSVSWFLKFCCCWLPSTWVCSPLFLLQLCHCCLQCRHCLCCGRSCENSEIEILTAGGNNFCTFLSWSLLFHLSWIWFTIKSSALVRLVSASVFNAAQSDISLGCQPKAFLRAWNQQDAFPLKTAFEIATGLVMLRAICPKWHLLSCRMLQSWNTGLGFACGWVSLQSHQEEAFSVCADWPWMYGFAGCIKSIVLLRMTSLHRTIVLSCSASLCLLYKNPAVLHHNNM